MVKGTYKVYKRKVRNTKSHPYGDQWPIIAASIKIRDGYKCRVSFLTKGRFQCEAVYPPPLTHLLHVHHIVERNRGGSDNPQNLITLCSDCHSKIHKRKLSRAVSVAQKQYGKRLARRK